MSNYFYHLLVITITYLPVQVHNTVIYTVSIKMDSVLPLTLPNAGQFATVCKAVRPMLLVRCLSVLSVLCLLRLCIVAKRLDGSRWNLARR